MTGRQFSGRVAIVTGGASGIGRCIARRLALEGAAVFVVDINHELAIAAATELRGAGCNASAIRADITRESDVLEMVAQVQGAFGRLDILVHSAGIGIERPFLKTSAEEWRHLIDVNLTGTFLCCKAAANAMIARGYGRIITISSTAGIRGGVGRAAYGAGKAGIITLTKVMAVELAASGITVNALAPGAIDTELVARMHSPRTRAEYRKAIPLDRYGSPEEVAACALFLASEDASYVTGHALAVDGGFLAAGLMGR